MKINIFVLSLFLVMSCVQEKKNNLEALDLLIEYEQYHKDLPTIDFQKETVNETILLQWGEYHGQCVGNCLHIIDIFPNKARAISKPWYSEKETTEFLSVKKPSTIERTYFFK